MFSNCNITLTNRTINYSFIHSFIITLSPDCKHIFLSFNALKVISPAVSEDILLAEAVFNHNSKLKKGTKLSPSQLVKGKQSEPPPVDDTTELTPSSTNRLKHLGVQAREKSEEVTNQHTSLVSYSAELVVKGNSRQVFNSHQPKPCKCGLQQPHNQSFQFISKKDERWILVFKKLISNHTQSPPVYVHISRKGEVDFMKGR